MFGLLGAGCIEAALAIFGAWPGRRDGKILVDGIETIIDTPKMRSRSAWASWRRIDAIASSATSRSRTTLALPVWGESFVMASSMSAAARRSALDQVDALDIKTASIDAEVRTLSGGNQQKVQIARWLAADTRILIMVDPTRGVDVGARREIKRIWLELGVQGQRDPACVDRRRGACRRLRSGHRDEPWPSGRRIGRRASLQKRVSCGWRLMAETTVDRRGRYVE